MYIAQRVLDIIYRSFIRKNGLFFRKKIASESDLEETAVHRKKSNSIPEETANVVESASKKDHSDLEKPGPIHCCSPGLNTSAKALKTSILGFQNMRECKSWPGGI